MSETQSNNIELEIIVQTKDIVHALNFTNSVIEKKNVMLELNNIKISTNEEGISITATDMDLYLNQNIGAKVIHAGETTVSSKTFSEIVRKITDTEIIIKHIKNSNTISINGKNCNFELLTLPTTQFPYMEDVDANISLDTDCKDLARILEYTNFAMSTEETRYNLNGTYLQIKGQHLYAVATDGHRLSLAATPLEVKTSEFGVIIPFKTIIQLLKIIKDPANAELMIKISLSENKVKFKCNNATLISKVIDGTFPEYEAFIPTENINKLTINRKILDDSISRIATVTIDKFRAIKMLINDKMIRITASGESKGLANESLHYPDNCSFSGSEIAIGCNPSYLSDVLSTLKEDQVDIYLKDSFSPLLIKTKNNPKDCFVIMPVKV